MDESRFSWLVFTFQIVIAKQRYKFLFIPYVLFPSFLYLCV